METINQSFGRRLRKMREAHNLTREKLGEELGISSTSVYSIERGSQWVSPKTLDAISTFFKEFVLLFKIHPAELR